MTKDERIDSLFNILVQYEKIFEKDSTVTESTYKSYLDRLYVWYLGYGNDDIANCLKGLYNLGASAEHDTVKRNVFYMIRVLGKE